MTKRGILTFLLLTLLTATLMSVLPTIKAESPTSPLLGDSSVVFATMQNAADETPVMYTLSITIDGQGSTFPAPGSYTYENGSEISISATDTSSLYGFLFEYWVLDGSITISKKNHNPLQLTMDQDHALTAVFLQAPPPYFPPESTPSPSSTPKPTVTTTPTPKSTPEIPELTPLVILPPFMIATLLTGVFCFKKRKR